jgi:cysteine desulfurase
VTTSIEHSSILENARALAELGVEITFVHPLPTGHVDPRDIAAAIRPNTALVSVMHANNETGAIQPVERIAAITRDAGVALHVDAVHTAGKIDIAGIGAQMVSISGHKFAPPRCRCAVGGEGQSADTAHPGGSQEKRRRAGTENVAGAMGMAAAAQVSLARISPAHHEATRAKRSRLIDGLRTIGGVEVNATDPVVQETVSVRFEGIRADALADALDMDGIYLSTGSACGAREDAVSHVLTAQGLPEDEARSAVRLSFAVRNCPTTTSTGSWRQRLRPSTGSAGPPEQEWSYGELGRQEPPGRTDPVRAVSPRRHRSRATCPDHVRHLRRHHPPGHHLHRPLRNAVG